MCLNKIYNIIPPATVIGFKVFKITMDTAGKYQVIAVYERVVFDKNNGLYTDPNKYDIHIAGGDKYPCGYHAYMAQYSAKKETIFGKVYATVDLHDIHTCGEQDGHQVWVAKSFKFTDDMRLWCYPVWFRVYDHIDWWQPLYYHQFDTKKFQQDTGLQLVGD
jgi:hypothetical protein